MNTQSTPCWYIIYIESPVSQVIIVLLVERDCWFVVVGETRRGVALTGCGFRLADVVPQWQRPVVVRRAGADSDGSSDDDDLFLATPVACKKHRIVFVSSGFLALVRRTCAAPHCSERRAAHHP